MKKHNKYILGLITGIVFSTSIIVFAVFRASASNITFLSDKTDKDNVEESLNELYDLSENCGGTSWCPDVEYPTCADGCLSNMYCLKSINVPDTTKKCKRAKNLHIEICSQTDTANYCSSTNTSYNGTDIFNGSTIVYGNRTITSGELHAGDAFTCDVNGDGLYDEMTERFYYVSDLYDGSTNTFDTNYATLIYYNSVINGFPDNTNNNIIAYNSNNKNNKGPITAITNLPNANQWKNVMLKTQTRQIRTETGTTSTSAGAISSYTYTDKSSRFLTYQELQKACGTSVSIGTVGYLDTEQCRFFMENTKYSSDSIGSFGFWLETPVTSSSTNVWRVLGNNRLVNSVTSYNTATSSVRPVIEVLKTDIAY